MKYGWEWKHKQMTFFGVSLAGIRTSLLIRELALCFDVAQGLPHCMSAKKLFLTHGHLDHASGLPYILSQMAMSKKHPDVFLPKGLKEPMEKILTTWQEIDDFPFPFQLTEVEPGEEISLSPKHSIKVVENYHRVSSVGYCLLEKRKKLQKQYASLDRKEILDLKSQGKEIEEIHQRPVFAFSGDTKVEFLSNPLVAQSEVIFMECTYIDEKKPISSAREWGHTHIDEIAAVMDSLLCEKLVLIHVSARYSLDEIKKTVAQRFPGDSRIVVFQGR